MNHELKRKATSTGKTIALIASGFMLAICALAVYETVIRLDALAVAWEHPDVVKDLQIEQSMEIVQR